METSILRLNLFDLKALFDKAHDLACSFVPFMNKPIYLRDIRSTTRRLRCWSDLLFRHKQDFWTDIRIAWKRRTPGDPFILQVNCFRSASDQHWVLRVLWQLNFLHTRVAQPVAQSAVNREVEGSNPSTGANKTFAGKQALPADSRERLWRKALLHKSLQLRMVSWSGESDGLKIHRGWIETNTVHHGSVV